MICVSFKSTIDATHSASDLPSSPVAEFSARREWRVHELNRNERGPAKYSVAVLLYTPPRLFGASTSPEISSRDTGRQKRIPETGVTGGAMRPPYPEVLRLTVKRFACVGLVVGMVLIRPNSSLVAPLHVGLDSRRHRHAPATSIHQPDQQQHGRRSPSTRILRRSLRRAGQAGAGATVVSIESGKEGHVLQAGLPEEHLLKPAFRQLEEVLTR